MIQQLIIQDEKKDEFLEFYNQISAKERLKQLTQFREQTLEAQSKDLKSFISQYQEQKEQNTASLKEQFKSFKTEQNLIALPLQNLMNQIDLFCEEVDQKVYQKKKEQNDQQQINNIFGKSAYCDFELSNKIQILENKNQNKLSIIKEENIYGQVYFKYQLNKLKTYVFRFKFNDKAGDYFLIGLIDENNLNTNLASTCQGKIFRNSNNLYGGKIVEGKYFHEVEKNFVIEMRVDIEKRQIQYLDYPHYQNINQLNDQYELDSNTNYFLAIRFGFFNKYKTCIDLIYFKEIEK